LGSSEDYTSTRPHCQICKRVIAESRSGSLTQWVFGEPCKCENPQPDRVPEQFKGASFNADEEDPNEVELEVDPEKFPSERYKALAVLGAGVSGTVYLGRDRLLRKRVAVKVLKTLEKDALIAFQNEAKTTSKLSHPNIVKILDFGITSGGVPYMVMEYVAGVSLEHYVTEQGPLDAVSAVSVFSKLAQALDYAHECGILHRDLKPSNILVNEKLGLEVYIIDFGVAKMQEQFRTTIVNGTALVGTPAYMSPDQALGNPFDRRSDVYSLGCILYESMTGQQPYVADSPLEVISLHAHSPIPSLLDTLAETPTTRALDDVVRTCLEKIPGNRFKTARLFAEALGAVPISGETTIAPTSAPVRGKSTPAWLMIAAALTITVGVSVLAFMYVFKVEGDEGEREAARLASKPMELRSYSTISNSGSFDPITIATDSANHYSLTAAVEATSSDLVSAVEKKGRRSFEVVSLSGADITPRALDSIDDCKSLLWISMPLGREHFEAILKFPSLTTLRVGDSEINFSDLAVLRKSKSLVDLNVVKLAATEELIDELSKFKSLQAIGLLGCSGFANIDITPLKDIPGLVSLDLKDTDANDETIKQLTELKNLETVSLPHSRISEQAFRHLNKLSKLKTVMVCPGPLLSQSAIDKFALEHKHVRVLKIEKYKGSIQ